MQSPEQPLDALRDVDMNSKFIAVAFLISDSDAERRLIEMHDVDNTATADDVEVDVNMKTFSGVFSEINKGIRRILTAAFNIYRTYKHVEVCLFMQRNVDGSHGEEMLSISARHDVGVTLLRRTFNNPLYVWHKLIVNADELGKIVNRIRSVHGRRYDLYAVSMVYFFPRMHAQNRARRWYCSELAMHILQCIDCPQLHEVRANCVDIDELEYHVLRSTRLDRVYFSRTPSEHRRRRDIFNNMNFSQTLGESDIMDRV